LEDQVAVKDTRISFPRQYGHRDRQAVPRRLGERDRFEHGSPLIRNLRASAQRSTSVLFSFALSLDYCGTLRSFKHRPFWYDPEPNLACCGCRAALRIRLPESKVPVCFWDVIRSQAPSGNF